MQRCLLCVHSEDLLTSLGVPWGGALTGVKGLVTDTGLVKAESRPEKCKPTLVSLPLGFQGPVCTQTREEKHRTLLKRGRETLQSVQLSQLYTTLQQIRFQIFNCHVNRLVMQMLNNYIIELHCIWKPSPALPICTTVSSSLPSELLLL